ncbi:MAG: 4-hydroxythreonine-4-phosphate dehydrogenase PdxA [Planctomycetes bacterium]|nr:4-hydroxythreonine-4-phosphate dehydrogenase PdxA [Planctomycetota bacterium]
MSRPVVALTVGDPCGIGPEIALRLLADGPLPARVLVVGDARALDRDRALVPGAPPLPVQAADGFLASDAPFALDEEADAAGRAAMATLPPLGAPAGSAGRASYAWVVRGATLSRSGAVDALVTGPVHKGAWGLAGIDAPGHTEVLAAQAGVPRVVMMLAGGPLRVALSTIHVPLARVPSLLSVDGIAADLAILHADLRARFGVASPRIGVCGLNPHAGEGGRFGDDEARVVAPAVARARAAGIDASGPWPADAVIPRAAAGDFDAVLALYHDQGLPAVKTLSPRGAVNVTLGLPFVRTSVDHGTAFDRAGRGTATAASLHAALALAVAMSRSTRDVPRPT